MDDLGWAVVRLSLRLRRADTPGCAAPRREGDCAMNALGLASLIVLAGCFDPALTTSEWPCPQAGTELTYDTFGQGFFANYCDRCHTGARNGAPDRFRFD